jgi:diguanylate cyclase (GGDEF)-like protein
LGGDEFLAILPGATLEGATIAAEKLRAALQEPYDVGGATAKLSASIGASFFPGDGEDSDALQKAADDALYEAKRRGKNRLAVAPGAGAPTARSAGS